MDEYEFEVWQDGLPMASTAGADREAVLKDALHYVAVYSQDGPVELYEVTRTRVPVQ